MHIFSTRSPTHDCPLTVSLQANSDRIWKLTAPTPDEALQWAQLLKDAIQQHYPTGEISRGEEETPIAGLGVWLLKKGEGLGALTGPKRRFFTLTRGTQSGLVKMAYAESEDTGPKGAILLSPLSNISSADRTVLIVSLFVAASCPPCVRSGVLLEALFCPQS
jgi:hypothetical protein